MIVRIKGGIITSMIKLLKEKSAVLLFVCGWVCSFPFQALRFPRGGRRASSVQGTCGVSPVPLIPLESARLPFQSTGCTKRGQLYNDAYLKGMNHLNIFSGCVLL
ncbi:hypothetical protein ACP2W0_16270 [Pseudobacillus badius]|uniref:hypothetical protein n=1 Tax=Bacillus badius TaxID=1455 RepID=UPI003CF0E86B